MAVVIAMLVAGFYEVIDEEIIYQCALGSREQVMKNLLSVTGMHRLLYVYNGFVIFVLMAFMCLTQERINQSMTARAFLESAGAVPQSKSPREIFSLRSGNYNLHVLDARAQSFL